MGLEAAMSGQARRPERKDREAETPRGASASPLSLSSDPAASIRWGQAPPADWVGALPRGPTMVGARPKQAVHQFHNYAKSLTPIRRWRQPPSPNPDTGVRGANQIRQRHAHDAP